MNMEQTAPMINMPMVVADAEGVTMSSRDLAEITGKQHQHIRRDVEAMCGGLGIDPSRYGHIYKDARNRDQSEYHLPKDLTLTLVAGYNVVLRKRIIDRWLELEGRGAPVAIDVRNPNQLALIASQLIEVNQEQAKQIEAMQETVAAHDKLTNTEGTLCITDAAKTLGVQPKQLFSWMDINGWTYRRPNSTERLAYQSKLTTGVMEHKTTTILRADGSEKVTTQVRVTSKGLSALAKLIQPVAVVVQ